MIPRSYPTLRSLASSIAAKWQTLLHVEAVRTPLAAPEILAHSIPATINLILDRAQQKLENIASPPELHRWDNGCERNPYKWFYRAGEQAMLEALVLAQSQSCTPHEREAELAALYRAINEIAEQDVGGFCEVCVEFQSCPIRVSLPPLRGPT